MKNSGRTTGSATRIQIPSLAVGLAIMFGGTLYPSLMMNAAGRADYVVAMLMLLAMSAGLVRGVGFVPRRPLWAWLFSGWTCAAAMGAVACLRLVN